ncbi:MAG: lamin tail domain-containing protein [Spirochaetales bacterium]|nr:lamin tail domain-containing protein [Spirochaetales bacterium]
MKTKLFLLFSLIAMLFFSCFPGPPKQNGSLAVRIEDQMDKLIAPAISMELDTIRLTVTGPGGYAETFDLEPGENLAIEDLLYGEYALLAEGLNENDEVIGTDTATAQVNNGEETQVSLTIRPIAGTGQLELEVSWPENVVQFPDLQAGLIGADGTVIPVVFGLTGSRASAALELDNGYYCLSIALYDGDFLCYGRMEIVRIVTDNTTYGSFVFTEINVNSGSLDINISCEMDNPLNVLINGTSDFSGIDEPLALSADTAEGLPGTSFAWYVSGIAVATGGSFTFSSSTPGIYRIDVAAFSVDGSRAGSAGFDVHVSEAVQNYTPISSVQGASHTSPLAGQQVENVIGVITAVQNKGFWMQSPGNGDGDPATSEGIYVYTYTTHSFQAGDLVLVDGTVEEYGYENELKTTELNFVTVEVLQSAYPLPDPVEIGLNGILPPDQVICNDASSTVYNSVFDPEEDGIDFFESLESMLVSIDEPRAVGGASYGEVPVVPKDVSCAQATARGGLYLSAGNANPQLIHIDTDAAILGLDALPADIGDYFSDDVSGIIGYSYGKFLVLPTVLPTLIKNAPAREITGLTPDPDQLTVATFNLENFPQDDENMTAAEITAKITDVAQTIVTGLGGPDIVGVQEMMDDSYDTNDGTVTAETNFTALVNAISAQGGPAYEFLEIYPLNNQEGGWLGANIRVGFLYNPARVGFVQAGTPSTTVPTEVIDTGSGPALTINPGRFSQDSFINSRRPLIAMFTFNGESVFVINNHFNSKGGDTALFGEYQPPVLSSETERLVQAAAIRDMVNSITAIDAQANIVVLGDLNDFQFSAPLAVLEQAGLQNLSKTLLPAGEQYSYIYNGNSQELDHIFASPALMENARVDIVHRNSEYDSESRVTDHDPVLAMFELNGGAPQPDSTLLISEYGEGSSNNKYIELYNSGTVPLYLDGYSLTLYSNGNTTATATLALSGFLAQESPIVIVHSSAAEELWNLADLTSGITNFNGDDCIILTGPDGSVVDQIGILGEDPGSYWPVASSGTTQNFTLVRKPEIIAGNAGDWTGSAGTNDSDSEWIVFPQDNWDNVSIR